MSITRTLFSAQANAVSAVTTGTIEVQSGDLLVAWVALRNGSSLFPLNIALTDSGASTPEWTTRVTPASGQINESYQQTLHTMSVTAAETITVTSTIASGTCSPLTLVVARLRSTVGLVNFVSFAFNKDPGSTTTVGSVVTTAGQVALAGLYKFADWYSYTTTGLFSAIAVPAPADRIWMAERVGAGSATETFTNPGAIAIAAVVIAGEPAVPTTPTGITIGNLAPTSATVSWTDASSDETGFKVEVAASPFTSWTPVATTAANVTTQVITGLTEGASYRARVAGTNANGDSLWAESSTFNTVAISKLKPITVMAAGPWTASAGTAVSAVDELTFDDADYITANATGTIVYRIESSTNPPSNNWHAVSFRARATNSAAVTVKWWQNDPAYGGVEIASMTVSPPNTFTTYRLELTSVQAAQITDRSQVYVSVTRS